MWYLVDMNRVKETITVNYLLNSAKQRNYEVTHRQILRWQNAGLLPRPQPQYLGCYGTEYIYPEKAIDQLLAICEIHVSKKERRLDRVAWHLWWQGYDIDMKLVRRLIRKHVGEWDTFRKKLTSPNKPGLSKTAFTIIKKSKTARFKSHILLQARRRVTRKLYDRFVRGLIEVTTGQLNAGQKNIDLYQYDAEVALGMHLTRTDNLAQSHTWMLSGERLSGLPEFLSKLSLVIVESKAVDNLLIETRDELRWVLNTLESLINIVERSYGSGALGLSFLRNLISLPFSVHIILLLFWVEFRKTKRGALILENITRMESKLKRITIELNVWDDLRKEIPELSEALSPETRGATQHNVRGSELRARYIARLRKLYKLHKEKLDDFWNRHPEYKKLVVDHK
jgi:hypothetical protein